VIVQTGLQAVTTNGSETYECASIAIPVSIFVASVHNMHIQRDGDFEVSLKGYDALPYNEQ